MEYQQQKREAIAAANTIAALLEQLSDESPETEKADAADLFRLLKSLKAGANCVITVMNRQDNKH